MTETSQISFNELFPNNFDTLCYKCKSMSSNIEEGLTLHFELTDKKRKEKINPKLQLATPEDAKEIVQVYFSVYRGTYPYKEMEDVKQVRRMIESGDYEFILFKNPDENDAIMGCFTAQFNHEEKRGYLRGYNVKPQYQGKFDVVKGMIGAIIGWFYKNRHEIAVWYGEIRTAHASSQYFCQVAGMKNIAFLPNKDIFLGEIESIIMHIGYSKKALREERSSKIPIIIPEVRNCFQFTQERYPFLNNPSTVRPVILLNKSKMLALRKKTDIQFKIDKFGYTSINIVIKGSSSYLRCLHTPNAMNIEKIKYHAETLEHLEVLLRELRIICNCWNIRYMEAIISAHEPFHQQLFLESGFRPRGYIPSWSFDKEEGKFKDHIVFNWYLPPVSPNLHLIDESWRFVEGLGFYRKDFPHSKK